MHACPSCQGDCDCEDLICAHLCIRFADEDRERPCVCGHGIVWHEDLDGGSHECQACTCVQFTDAEVVK